MDRRDFLFMGTGAATGGLMARILGRGNSNKPQIIYKSGDVIEHSIGPIHIDGWNLLFDKKMLEEYARQLKEGVSERFVIAGDGKRFSSFIDIKPYHTDGPAPLLNGNYVLGYIPNPDVNVAYLAFERMEEGKIVHTEARPIAFTFYTHRPAGSVVQRAYVLSEVPLEDKVLADVHYMQRTFESYEVETPVVHITNSPQGKEHAEARPDTKKVIVTADSFTKPSFPNEGMITTYHELAHTLLWMIKLFPNNATQFNELVQAYKGLEDKMPSIPRGNLSFGRPRTRFFDQFGEASYIPELNGSGAGHPQENPEELFASAMTVFRFFPEEFSKAYEIFDASDRGAIANTGRAVLNTLAAVNHREPHLRNKVLPSYDKMMELFS